MVTLTSDAIDTELRRAVTLHQQGNLVLACEIYQNILSIQPDHPDAKHLLGTAMHQTGDHETAIRLISEAVHNNRTNPVYRINLAAAMLAANNYDSARSELNTVISQYPKLAEAHYSLGILSTLQGNHETAIKHLRNAISHKAQYPQAHEALADALATTGEYHEALPHYQQALASDSRNLSLQHKLASCLLEAGNSEEACNIFSSIHTQLTPTQKSVFLKAASHRTKTQIPTSLVNTLLDGECLNGVNLDPISNLVLSSLTTKYEPALSASDGYNPDTDLSHLVADPLFHNLLKNCLLRDHLFERRLAHIRYEFLSQLTTGHNQQYNLELLSALSIQCFNNEYVYFVTEDERALLDALSTELSNEITNNGLEPLTTQLRLLALSLYGHLSDMDFFPSLPVSDDKIWQPFLRPVILRHIDNHLSEIRLAKNLEPNISLDERSVAYQKDYDTHPYPRWIEIPTREESNLHQLRGMLHKDKIPQGLLTSTPRILVAGCGTGLEAISIALNYPGCRVTGIDFSPRSIAYAQRKSSEHNISNVEFRVGDILKLDRINERFTIIICTGVLHHIKDSKSAITILTSLLETHGLMAIGVYSKRGRAPIEEAKTAISKIRGESTHNDIRALRNEVFSRLDMPNDPISCFRHVISMRDFYSLSQSRFILSDIDEHNYTPLEIDALIRECNLRFLGFQNIDARTVSLYREQFPDDDYLTDLRNWEVFEERHPNSFASMFRFICQLDELN